MTERTTGIPMIIGRLALAGFLAGGMLKMLIHWILGIILDSMAVNDAGFAAVVLDPEYVIAMVVGGVIGAIAGICVHRHRENSKQDTTRQADFRS